MKYTFTRKTTPEQRIQIVEEYQQGQGLSELSRKYQADRGTIRYYIRHSNIPLRDDRNRIGKWDRKIKKIKVELEPTEYPKIISYAQEQKPKIEQKQKPKRYKDYAREEEARAVKNPKVKEWILRREENGNK